MALITCPDCGANISDMADVCIHCGYPIANMFNDYCDIINDCEINGVVFDLTYIKEQALVADDIIKYNELIKLLCSATHTLSSREAASIIDQIRLTGEVPPIFNSTKKENPPINIHQIYCPKCHSTSISTGSRGYSLAWGFIGANKTVNRCANCGHSWQPRK